jgi:subtilisin-like proprotein convertase family protein/subtilisin family serine protease
MAESQQTYTYRNGQKVVLEKRPDEFVVRAMPEELEKIGIPDAEQVSSASSRVTTRAADLEPLMSRSRHLAPTHHAYYVVDTGEEFLITDRIFVTFREALSDEQVDAFAGRYGLLKLAAYGERDYLFQLTDHTGLNPVKLVVKLMEAEPLVEAAEHDLNQRMNTYQFALPTDPAYARQWHLHTHHSHPDVDLRSSARCEEAWQLLNHFGSPEVVIGLTDDGCKLTHLDFDAPGKFAGWGYFRGSQLITNVDINADPDEMYKPGSNHGTSCAGVIAGEVDAVLTVGAAPGCRLLPIQWESSGSSLFISDSKLLTALNYLADKVDVMSNSWGSVPLNTWVPQVVNRIKELAQSGGRRGRGIVFLWAAGNENCPIQHTANLDVPYTSGWEMKLDGSQVWVKVKTARQFQNNLVGIPGLMHVAALASTAQRSHYSNYGTGIMLCAPTNNVHKYRRLTVRGLGVTTTTGSSSAVTDFFGGTSSATPLVAGIAGLVISANPELTALEVISILKQTASKDLNLEGYPRTSAANFDPDTSWDVSPIAPFASGDFSDIEDPDGAWSPWFGHGRADAAKAVAEALRRRVAVPQQTVRKTSAPALDIPDNDPAGVRDTITFSESLDLSAIKVLVDISHTYIGDLRLTLTAPSGAAAVLHNRSGGNADNLQRTFDLAAVPGLSVLLEQSIQGDWSLHVQDLAKRDVGRLNRWELVLEGRADGVVLLEEAPGTAIPDNKPAGIERQLQTNETGQVRELEVAIDITHTYIGDLLVTLVSPAGTTVTLHQRAGQSADNLITTYTPATKPALQTLRGESIQGTWQLKVADLAAIDVGKLNRWGLRIVRDS